MLLTQALTLCSSLLDPIGQCYANNMAAHPLITRSVVCAGLFGTSDVMAQLAERRLASPADDAGVRSVAPRAKPSLDGERLARMAGYAAFVDAPLTGWFVHTCELLAPGDTVQAILTKVAMGQVVWGPTIVFVYLTTHALLRGGGVGGVSSSLRRGWLSAVVASYRVWPLVYLANFSLIPEAHRVTFTAAANLFWVAFLSIVGNKATSGDSCEPPPASKFKPA